MPKALYNLISVLTCKFLFPYFASDYTMFSPITRRLIEETKGYVDNLQIKIFSNQACIGKKDLPVFINISEDSLQTEVSCLSCFIHTCIVNPSQL